MTLGITALASALFGFLCGLIAAPKLHKRLCEAEDRRIENIRKAWRESTAREWKAKQRK